MRVLIADDSALERTLVQRVIQGLGHECLVASDGSEAWQLWQSRGADVLVCDWMMPGLNGADLCRRVRAHSEGSYPYIILLTVLDDSEHSRHGMLAGADDYLCKPLRLDELERRLIAAQRVTETHRRYAARDELREHTLAWQSALLTFSQRISTAHSAAHLLTQLLSEATELLKGAGGAISLWDEQREVLVPTDAGHRDFATPALQAASLTCAQRRAPLITSAGETEHVGIVAAPMLFQERLLGVVAVHGSRAKGNSFTPTNAEVLYRLADLGAAGLVGLRHRPPDSHAHAQPLARGTVHHVPIAPTPLVGRDADVERLVANLAQPHTRLVTLTGPAGVGKTRLAIAVAEGFGRTLADGAVFVGLEQITTPTDLLTAIADACAAPAGEPAARVDQALGGRECLVVLDALEHLLAVAEQIGGLLAAHPSVKVLITSRTPLRLRLERVWPVSPLGVPPIALHDPAALASYPAIDLLVDRIRASQPEFSLDESNADSIAEVCRRLDGLPLALELAAARAAMLGPEALLAAVRHPLDLLVSSELDRPPRHRSLATALAASEVLLADGDRQHFYQLAVLAGDFTVEAVASLWDESDEASILLGLDRLVDSSLLQVSDSRGTPRFRMLATTRAYARAQLDATGHLDLDKMLRRHAVFFAMQAEQALSGLRSADQALWLERLCLNSQDMEAALDNALRVPLAVDAATLATVLGEARLMRGELTLAGAALMRAQRLVDSEQVGALARARLVGTLGRVQLAQGNLAAAIESAEAGLVAARDCSDLALEAAATIDLAVARSAEGSRRRDARGLALAGRKLADQAADLWASAYAAWGLGEVGLPRGQPAEAGRHYVDGARRAQRVGDQVLLARCLEGLALSAAARERWEFAVRLSTAAARVRERQGIRLVGVTRERLDSVLATAHTELGSAEKARAIAAGQSDSIDELIAAYEADRHRRVASDEVAAPAELSALTPREREVASLVASGHPNREVAARLNITEHTVEVHVSNVFAKLGLSSRTQLASVMARGFHLTSDQPGGST
jgi:predicted ATPase/DNA-binding NarL/FixJ family response regulator